MASQASKTLSSQASIAVVGGSIGGLTAACLLRDAGYDVTVYERSSRELEQRGAGIGFLEASSRYLSQRAGVNLNDISVVTPFIRYMKRDNDVLLEKRHEYRFSSWNTVYRQLLEVFGPERYTLNAELEGWSSNGDKRVELSFVDGESKSVDLLVCAEGVGSNTRARLLPSVEREYAGYVAWRGMVPEASLPAPLRARLVTAITYYVFANSHILVYPIPGLDGSVAPGERLINFVWYRNYMEGGELDDLLTDSTGVRRELSVPPGYVAQHHVDEARAFAAARLPDDVAAVVMTADDLFIQVVYDVDVPQMVFDRACLLGDAAFVARPHAAAGTAKAAEDGWQLMHALSGTDSIDAALAQWERSQLNLGRALVERARSIGRRSQVENSWVPGDPAFLFGLHHAGES